MKRRTKRRMEFSKKILLVAGAINIGVIVFACVMIWRTVNLEPLAYLIPAVAAEVATGTGYYYWKAKAENTIKLRKKYGIEPDKEEEGDDP